MPYHEPMPDRAERRQRIAFFGGSFDPPHLGHIGIARAAQTALDLDTVLFAPVGIQPLKPHGSTASYEDRVAMTELAIKGVPEFAICLVDAPNQNGVPNYTIDTLLRLRKQFPSAALFTLMGADSLLNLPHWHRGADVPFLAPLIVASRPGEHLADLATIWPAGLSIHEDTKAAQGVAEGSLRTFTLRNAAGASTEFYLLPGIEIEISATEVRQQVSAALDRLCAGHELLPDAVCHYIAAHGLYR
ncbi:MAG TPA: nicotinate (nicotinamide) nucleotide adenylyltransferase [Terracidiphilus sp.]|nr:nicotinate (nicotinamide) nucleotide adenylyltransferase [Terracidiphilus sp.]